MTEPDKPISLLSELKRRKVVRVGIAYGAAVFVVLQLADLVFPALGVPDWGFRFLVIGSLVGFPVAVILAWLYDLTPDGVRRTGRHGDAGPVVARLGQVALYTAAAIGVFTVLFVAFVWVQPRSAMGDVAPGASVIAVLPFTTEGSEVEVLGEGMVDLLSRNLNQLGVIRTVDPRTVLIRWNEQAQDGRLPPEAAYQLAREVGAGSILWGNVLEIGNNVRMDAELVNVDGVELARAEVAGSADDVLNLVDSLSVDLVRDIWRATRPIPSVDLSTITSGDLTALRYFLDGERFYRASQWDSAVAYFSAAVEADSNFALAYVRLSYTAGWAAGTPEIRALEQRAAVKAVELVDRLPSRTQSLVRALGLWVGGPREEAVDTLKAMVNRHPDDLEANYFLTDAGYHISYEGLGPVRPAVVEVLEPFERIQALDPSFSPAFIHPFEVAFLRADTALIDRYYRALVSRADSLALAVYEAGLEALRRPRDLEALATGLNIAFVGADAGLGGLGAQAARAVTFPLLRSAATLDAESQARLLQLLRADEESKGRASDAQLLARRAAEVRLLQNGGRIEAARQLLEASAARGEIPAGHLEYFSRTAVYGGFADSSYLAISDAHRPGAPAWAIAELIAALDARDAGRTDAAVKRLRSVEMSDAEAKARLVRQAELFQEFDRAPDVATLRELEDALNEDEFVWGGKLEALWFRWLERMAGLEATRPEAIALLETPWVGEPIYEAPRLYALARALEADGAVQTAGELCNEFLSALAAADDGLPLEEKRADARQALERLGR
jgi:TolB-like protein